MMNGDEAIPNSANRAGSRWKSFVYAFAGIRYVLKSQENAWIHAAFTLAVIVVGLWLRIGQIDWAILALTVGMVWVAEFMNTALEATIDLASPEVHPLAKIGKDAAAGGVLVAAITAVIVGLLVLGPPLLKRLAPTLEAIFG